MKNEVWMGFSGESNKNVICQASERLSRSSERIEDKGHPIQKREYFLQPCVKVTDLGKAEAVSNCPTVIL